MKIREALTFDDVLLEPSRSAVLPAETNVATRLTRYISLNIPLVSAAMDTVTEHRLAIAMAQAGGIGVIHKNMNIESQAAEISRVKKYESGMVVNPLTITPERTLGEALELMKTHQISGIPVVDGEGKPPHRLVGILTNRDVRFASDLNQKVWDLMTREVITIGESATQEDAKRLLHEHRIEKLVVVDGKQSCIGLITVKDIEKAKNHPMAAKDNAGRLLVAAATGAGPEGQERAEALIEAGADVVVVDTAHGHSEGVLGAVGAIRKMANEVQVIGGNVATADGAKALAAGGDCAMIGSLLAGTDETPGEVFLHQGRSYKAYRGMGSTGAMARGSADRYFQAEVSQPLKLVPEGIEGQVPYKGPVENVLHQLMGGVRAAMGYTGNATIADLQANVKFLRITGAGLSESHVHDVTITREEPNYRPRV